MNLQQARTNDAIVTVYRVVKKQATYDFSLNCIESPLMRLDFSSPLSVKEASEFYQLVLNILCAT